MTLPSCTFCKSPAPVTSAVTDECRLSQEEITPVHACALAERPFLIRRAKSEEGINIENEILFQIKSEAAIDDEKPKEAKDEEREEEIEAYEESTKVEKKVVDNIVDLTRVLLIVWAVRNINNPA